MIRILIDLAALACFVILSAAAVIQTLALVKLVRADTKRWKAEAEAPGPHQLRGGKGMNPAHGIDCACSACIPPKPNTVGRRRMERAAYVNSRVAALHAEGLSRAFIAERLGVSMDTIRVAIIRIGKERRG